MSFLLEKDTDEIQRIGQALRVNQRFRAPREFGVNVGGERAVVLGSTIADLAPSMFAKPPDSRITLVESKRLIGRPIADLVRLSVI